MAPKADKKEASSDKKPRPASRAIIRWNDDKLVLAFHEFRQALNRRRVDSKAAMDDAAKAISSTCTGDALVQQLTKRRNRLMANLVDPPPPPSPLPLPKGTPNRKSKAKKAGNASAEEEVTTPVNSSLKKKRAPRMAAAASLDKIKHEYQSEGVNFDESDPDYSESPIKGRKKRVVSISKIGSGSKKKAAVNDDDSSEDDLPVGSAEESADEDEEVSEEDATEGAHKDSEGAAMDARDQRPYSGGRGNQRTIRIEPETRRAKLSGKSFPVAINIAAMGSVQAYLRRLECRTSGAHADAQRCNEGERIYAIKNEALEDVVPGHGLGLMSGTFDNIPMPRYGMNADAHSTNAVPFNSRPKLGHLSMEQARAFQNHQLDIAQNLVHGGHPLSGEPSLGTVFQGPNAPFNPMNASLDNGNATFSGDNPFFGFHKTFGGDSVPSYQGSGHHGSYGHDIGNPKPSDFMRSSNSTQQSGYGIAVDFGHQNSYVGNPNFSNAFTRGTLGDFGTSRTLNALPDFNDALPGVRHLLGTPFQPSPREISDARIRKTPKPPSSRAARSMTLPSSSLNPQTTNERRDSQMTDTTAMEDSQSQSFFEDALDSSLTHATPSPQVGYFHVDMAEDDGTRFPFILDKSSEANVEDTPSRRRLADQIEDLEIEAAK